MRVLILANSIRPGGGPAGYTYNLISGLTKLSPLDFDGYTISIDGVIFEICGKMTEARNPALWKVDEKLRNSVRTIFDLTTGGLWRKIRRYFRRFSADWRRSSRRIDANDVIVFQGFQDPSLMKYASNRGKKCLYMPHSPTIAADEYKMACDHDGVWVNPFLYDTLFKYEKYLMSIATAVIFPSRNAASSYFDAFDVLRSKTIEFILSGVDVKIDGSTSRSRKRRSLRVLFAGRYVSHKGFDLFNELAEHARNAGNRFDFFSVGIGPISPSKYVSNLGWRKDIYDVVSQHDIIVVPNRIAYFDLLPLEVAAIGKPILFTPVGGNIDQADALDDTICAEAMNVSSLYEGLIKIEENLQKNQNYGAKNSIRYSELFTSEKMAARWLAVLKAL